MTARLVLDTTAYSHFRAANDAVAGLLARAEIVYVPSVVLGELEGGFRGGSRYRENRRVLDDFLDEPFVETLPITTSVATHYGRLFADFRRAGTPVPTNDLWIAAATVDCGGHLVTFDAHFERFEGLPKTMLGRGR